MKNIEGIKDCFGCGVCATVCGRNAIAIKQNEKGFYTPVVDSDMCTNCGLCVDVCAFKHDDLALKLEGHVQYAYGAWSNKPNVRRRCSSGGVGYELGLYLLNEGYKICAVRYNAEQQRAEHYIATNEKELMPSIGSKYIQSYTVDGFKTINRKEKYLVTGTPCQIDSFRRYLRKFKVEDNFILMDFFCHSVPSMLAWKKYLQIVEKRTGPIVYASWRNKFTGWHDSWALAIDGVNDCKKNCKYKYDQSSVDIRIGDFWGKTYAKDEDGVSAVVAFTEKGNDIMKSLDCTLIEHPFETVAEGQMKKNAGKAYISNLVFKALKDKNSTESTFRLYFKVEAALKLPRRIINKLHRMLWERK